MKCKHLKDGICEKLSDSEVKQPCVMGPCEFDTRNISEAKNIEYKEFTDTQGNAIHTATLSIKSEIDKAYLLGYQHGWNKEVSILTGTVIPNTRTASPRFTSSEIQAIETVLKMAEQSENVPFKEIHLSRVRFMLQEDK